MRLRHERSAQPSFSGASPCGASTDLFNDGILSRTQPENALLVAGGDRGEIVQVGAHVETNTTVYLVEFSDSRVVGCLEDEIAPQPPTESPGP